MKNRVLCIFVMAVSAIIFGTISRAEQTVQAAQPTVVQPTSDSVRKWAVDRMVAWSRPGVTLHPPAMESFEDGKARYNLIADAVFRTVSKNKPIFGGTDGRVRTAALILSVSMFESAYRKDVDMNLGKLGRGDMGRSWCLMQIQLGSPILVDSSGRRKAFVRVCSDVLDDSGAKISTKCEYVPPPDAKPSTPNRIILSENGYEFTSDQTRGYSGQDLVADRELCFTAGLRIIRQSFSACKGLPMLERLSAYASGNCNDGKEASRKRMGAAVRWLSSYPAPVNDDQLIGLFAPPPPPPAPVNSKPVGPFEQAAVNGHNESIVLSLLP